MKARASIATWLWMLVLLPAVPMLGFLGYSTYRYAQEREHLLEARLIDHAEDLSQNIQSQLDMVAGTLTTLSRSRVAMTNDIPGLYAFAKRLPETPKLLRAISLVDQSGKLIFVTTRPLGANLAPVDLTSVRETFVSGKPNLSSPAKSPISGRNIVALNMPIVHNGQVVYSLRGILDLHELSQQVGSTNHESAWLTSLVDSRGILLARSRSPELYVGQPASPALQQAIRTHNREVFRGKSKEGIEVTAVSTPVGAWGWTVAMAVPTESLIAPLRQELAEFAMLTLVVLFCLTLLVTVLHMRITRGLTIIAQDAERALYGPLGPTKSTNIRELDVLRDSLTRADVYRKALLEQVDTKTAALSEAQQRLTEFTQQMQDDIERERLRIAREVHDQIGAVFTGVSMLVNGRASAVLPDNELRVLNDALSQGLATVRRITAELRPPLLDDLGLQSAVEDMARTLLSPGNIASRVILEDGDLLTPRQTIGCFRIMQEAVTNVLRHSGCHLCEITGQATIDNTYVFNVMDDGVGLGEHHSLDGHYGVVGMRERARLMGGDLSLENRPGGGAMLRVFVPLSQKDPPHDG